MGIIFTREVTEVVEVAVAALVVVFALLRGSVPFFAGDAFLAAVFLAGAFFAGVFFAGVFFATAFLAAGFFLAGAFFTTGFFFGVAIVLSLR